MHIGTIECLQEITGFIHHKGWSYRAVYLVVRRPGEPALLFSTLSSPRKGSAMEMDASKCDDIPSAFRLSFGA